VAFADHRVAWLQEVAVAACHHVLRRMGDPRSAVRWQAPHGPAHTRVNRALVDLFGELVDAAAGVTPGEPAAEAASRAIQTLEQALTGPQPITEAPRKGRSA
jgi:hypothetical protein